MMLLSFRNGYPPPKGHLKYWAPYVIRNISPCSQVVWAGRDLNSRRPKSADLQSAPIDHSGTYPVYYFILKESQVGFKPTIKNFADSRLNHLPTGTYFCF